jgi:serine/threonine protein kinase
MPLNFFMNRTPCYLNFIKSVIFQLLEVLIYLHTNQIIHRDIKPSNVLVSQYFDQDQHVDLKTQEIRLFAHKININFKIKTQEIIGIPKFEDASNEVKKKEEQTDSNNWEYVDQIKETLITLCTPEDYLDLQKEEKILHDAKNKYENQYKRDQENLKLGFFPICESSQSIDQDETSVLKKYHQESEKNTKIVIKLIDFGVSKKFNIGEKSFSPNGDPAFQAPEIRKQGFYDSKVDIWGVGLIFFGLLQGREINKIDGIKIRSFKMMGILDELGTDLLEKLLRVDSNDRIDAEEAIKHPWFRQTTTGES